MHDADSTATVDDVVDIAIGQFAEHGFHETRLDTVADLSGMSKRMIHYHFGDKKGLYHRALTEAASRIMPDEADLTVDSSVPVEGVALLVDAMYTVALEQPEAVRLLVLESVQRVLNVTELASLTDQSEASLHLDRLLMLGQDLGAFRPGIAAEDLFYLIHSLAFSRIVGRDLMANLFHMDTMSEENTEGIRRLCVDGVIAFLTANIPDSEHSSYLCADLAGGGSQSTRGIYGGDTLV